MRTELKNLNSIFSPSSVAVIGVSQNLEKVGSVVLKNLVDGGYSGQIYPVNPKYEQILGYKCYSSISEIGQKVDCAVIATPSESIPEIAEECGKAGVKGLIVLSGGFGEAGKKDLELKLHQTVKKYEMALVGVNCLGVLDPSTGVDSIFLPMYKLQRPPVGGTSFITQSGAVGSSVMDMVAHHGVGVSKFISYGNGTSLNEIDFLEFLENDPKTKQIIVYIEGTKDGKKFYEALKRVNQKKPIVILKAGKEARASKAAFSHTGNIAGNYMAYRAAFRQSGVIEAENIDQLFDFIKIFSQPLPKRKEVAVITNGGGLGILTTDELEGNKLPLADFSASTSSKLKSIIPPYANVGNPLDVIADAKPELYDKAIEILMDDKTIGALIIIVLYQVPAMDESIIGILEKASKDRRKPIIVIAVGGEYISKFRRALEKRGIPTYGSPQSGVGALKRFFDYADFKKP